ncbi:hydrophobin [Collybia nuda]|uniref:Hydrophobin n=1 Tax=Collybia nuda TaxID=64659 RepID=A0A9P6CJ20_9AGAR|nr:hydrophobin [Collybia nuda]
MFSKVAIVATLSLALSVAAGDSYKCNTGDIQCCNSLQRSESTSATKLLTTLGMSLQGLTGMIGTGCSPISAVGVGGGASCSQQPVCCENNDFNGLIAIGCTPINTSL